MRSIARSLKAVSLKAASLRPARLRPASLRPARLRPVRFGQLAAIAGLLLLCLAATARAADAPKTGPAGDNEGWQNVQTQMVQPGEGFEAKSLVGAAYGFIWLMVAGFVVTVWRRADRIDKEIDALRAQVAAKQKPAGAGPGRS